jgi:hypothetical protein
LTPLDVRATGFKCEVVEVVSLRSTSHRMGLNSRENDFRHILADIGGIHGDSSLVVKKNTNIVECLDSTSMYTIHVSLSMDRLLLKTRKLFSMIDTLPY